MKILKIILLVSSLLLVSCTSVTKTSPQSNPQISGQDGQSQQIMITNYGYYLFNCIPLASGSYADGSFEMFSDKVNLPSVTKSFSDQCKELGVTKISNVQIEKTSTCFFDWAPILSSTFGIYWYKEIQLSASINTTTTSPSTSK